MRWGQFRLRSAVHLISRLRRQLPLIGEAVGVRKSKASPSRGGGTAIAVTERSYQICGNLSVTFGDSSPARGGDMLSSEVQHLKKKKDNTHSKV